MVEDERFQQIVQQVCNLVECDSAQLLLGCIEPTLRHPLLVACSIIDYHEVGYTGKVHSTDLLQNEQLRALCDVAVQVGQVQSLERWPVLTDDTEKQSFAVVSLELPTGVLGLLLLTDSRIAAFSIGECLLLSRFMPHIAQKVETVLTYQRNTWCFSPLNRNGATPQGKVIVSQENAQANGKGRLPVQQQVANTLDRVKNEFISMVSHEIRNPLTAIKGYAVLLQTYSTPEQINECGVAVMSPQRQREYLEHIMEQTQHLEVLINDLLDISRLQAGRLQLRYQQVNVVELCQRVVQSIQQKYAQSSAHCPEIVCTFEPHLPHIWIDPNRLQQVLTNLLDNAMKYSPAGGKIEVRLALHRHMITITVRDSGIGITQQQQQQLFQPFKRLEHPLTNDIPGVGIGLYITRKLIEAMHGEISLTSYEGQGTTVTFNLPCAEYDLLPDKIEAVSCGRSGN